MSEWTTGTRDLVAATMVNHQDHLEPGAIRCSCGWSVAGHPIGAVAAAEAFFAHKADAVLTALTKAGRRILAEAPDDGDSESWGESPNSGPRVWAMPQIPPEVKRVRDNTGDEWVRADDAAVGHWEVDTDDSTRYGISTEADLIKADGPLTEVLPNGD